VSGYSSISFRRTWALPTSQLNIERTWDEGRYTRANVLRELLRTQILAATHSSWPAVRAADQC
jgi:hypothetical protein